MYMYMAHLYRLLQIYFRAGDVEMSYFNTTRSKDIKLIKKKYIIYNINLNKKNIYHVNVKSHCVYCLLDIFYLNNNNFFKTFSEVTHTYSMIAASSSLLTPRYSDHLVRYYYFIHIDTQLLLV